MGSRRRSLVPVVAVVLASLTAACAGDDDAEPVQPGATTLPADRSATPSAPAGSAVEPPAPQAPDASRPPPDPGTPADEELNALFASLPAPETIGVPPDWAVRELTSRSAPELLEAPDADPLLGLLQCPDGVLRELPTVPWVARRLATPGVELENGLLAIELIVEDESKDEFDADVTALTETCTADEQVVVETSTTTLDLTAASAESVVATSSGDSSPTTGVLVAPKTSVAGTSTSGTSLDATVISVRSAPTAAVPYASAWTLVTANDGERTATVLLSGLDFGDDWTEFAPPIAAQLFTEPPS